MFEVFFLLLLLFTIIFSISGSSCRCNFYKCVSSFWVLSSVLVVEKLSV